MALLHFLHTLNSCQEQTPLLSDPNRVRTASVTGLRIIAPYGRAESGLRFFILHRNSMHRREQEGSLERGMTLAGPYSSSNSVWRREKASGFAAATESVPPTGLSFALHTVIAASHRRLVPRTPQPSSIEYTPLIHHCPKRGRKS